MTEEELKQKAEELKQKAKDFIDRINKESDGMWFNNYYLTDLLVMFATEETKELQEEIKACKFAMTMSEKVEKQLREQIEKMKSDVRGNIKWADWNKNDQMWQKLVKMYNQWS